MTQGDRPTIEEQIQGVLLSESQGDLQGDLKALSDIAQGEQGDLTYQLSYRENQVGENLEALIQSPLEKEPTCKFSVDGRVRF